jgi:hypothetical protein
VTLHLQSPDVPLAKAIGLRKQDVALASESILTAASAPQMATIQNMSYFAGATELPQCPLWGNVRFGP